MTKTTLIAILAVITLTTVLVMTGCKDKNNDQPPVATPTPVIVVETPTATPPVHPSCPIAQAPTLKCYDWAPCQGLFANAVDALAALVKNDAGGCSKIDGEVVKGGFGPCSECNTIGRMQAKSALPTFEEVLKARDGKTRVEMP